MKTAIGALDRLIEFAGGLTLVLALAVFAEIRHERRFPWITVQITAFVLAVVLLLAREYSLSLVLMIGLLFLRAVR